MHSALGALRTDWPRDHPGNGLCVCHRSGCCAKGPEDPTKSCAPRGQQMTAQHSVHISLAGKTGQSLPAISLTGSKHTQLATPPSFQQPNSSHDQHNSVILSCGCAQIQYISSSLSLSLTSAWCKRPCHKHIRIDIKNRHRKNCPVLS